MDPITTVLILMLSVAIFALLASKLGVPYPTMMVVGGLAISIIPNLQFVGIPARFIPSLQSVEIPPDLIFTLFLPPLLYGAAWQISWKEFWAARRPIFFLAVGLVLFTTLGIALIAKRFIPGFTWASAFALGAIVSPPDAIAVTALTQKIRLPRRLILLLEGESLVNDASALVALRFAVAAALTGSFSIAHAAGQFLLVSAGGILLGLVIGWLAVQVHRLLEDAPVETTLTFLTPYAAYLIAENLGVSGVLATVAAGLYVSWRAHEIMQPQLRIEAYAVWGFVLFLLNGFVFVLLGLQLPAVLNAVLKSQTDVSTRQLVAYGFLCVIGIIALRIAWVLLGTFLPWLFTPRNKRPAQPPSLRETLLLGWTGMRGVVSLAAALALPLTVADGSPFPNRGIIIFITFFIILVTLVLQSLTLPLVVRFLGVQTVEDELAEEREARLHALRAAHKFLKDLTASTDAFGEVGVELLSEYQRRITHLEVGHAPLPVATLGLDTSAIDLHREVFKTQRDAIVELRANQKISTELYQLLMTDLAAEELRLHGRH